jgi:beta-lactamase class A
LTLRFLLEQMLVHSDNTATDLILRETGLRNVNARLHRIEPRFHEITTLSDVRRLTYSGIFPAALSLKNEDILRLKAVRPARKVRALASVLEENPKDAHTKSLHEAFSAYYGRKLNSAPLEAYGSLLEKIEKGEILRPESRALLLEIMERVETGRRRIRAALSPEFIWAHKTGTQFERVCDFGFAWPAKSPEHKVVIAACTQGLPMRKAEGLLRRLGRAVRASGVLSAESSASAGNEVSAEAGGMDGCEAKIRARPGAGCEARPGPSKQTEHAKHKGQGPVVSMR